MELLGPKAAARLVEEFEDLSSRVVGAGDTLWLSEAKVAMRRAAFLYPMASLRQRRDFEWAILQLEKACWERYQIPLRFERPVLDVRFLGRMLPFYRARSLDDLTKVEGLVEGVARREAVKRWELVVEEYALARGGSSLKKLRSAFSTYFDACFMFVCLRVLGVNSLITGLSIEVPDKAIAWDSFSSVWMSGGLDFAVHNLSLPLRCVKLGKSRPLLVVPCFSFFGYGVFASRVALASAIEVGDQLAWELAGGRSSALVDGSERVAGIVRASERNAAIGGADIKFVVERVLGQLGCEASLSPGIGVSEGITGLLEGDLGIAGVGQHEYYTLLEGPESDAVRLLVGPENLGQFFGVGGGPLPPAHRPLNGIVVSQKRLIEEPEVVAKLGTLWFALRAWFRRLKDEEDSDLREGFAVLLQRAFSEMSGGFPIWDSRHVWRLFDTGEFDEYYDSATRAREAIRMRVGANFEINLRGREDTVVDDILVSENVLERLESSELERNRQLDGEILRGLGPRRLGG